MTVMKVRTSLPSLSSIVYRIMGRTDTPVGVGTEDRQLERCSLSFIIALLCGVHHLFSFLCILPTLFFQAFYSPPISLFLSVLLTSVYLHFSLSLKQLPSHLSPPPPLCSLQPPTLFPTFPPPGWQCLDRVEHGRTLNIHHSRTSRKHKSPAILDSGHHFSLRHQSQLTL